MFALTNQVQFKDGKNGNFNAINHGFKLVFQKFPMYYITCIHFWKYLDVFINMLHVKNQD